MDEFSKHLQAVKSVSEFDSLPKPQYQFKFATWFNDEGGMGELDNIPTFTSDELLKAYIEVEFIADEIPYVIYGFDGKTFELLKAESFEEF